MVIAAAVVADAAVATKRRFFPRGSNGQRGSRLRSLRVPVLSLKLSPLDVRASGVSLASLFAKPAPVVHAAQG